MALTQNTIDLQTILTAVQNLPEPEPAPEFTENGTYTAPSGTAWNEVNINVPVPEVGEKTISENGTYTADTGTAWDTVQVQVPQTEIDTLNVTEKKTYTAPEGHAYGVVNVGIPFWSGEIEVVGPEMPNKGDLISMDLGNGSKQYRVLKINGTVAEVLGTYDVGYGTGVPHAVTVLNNTFYDSLSNTAKSAIVDKDITRYNYTYDMTTFSSNHALFANYSSKTVKEALGDQHVYLLDVADIEEYFNGVFTNSDIEFLYPGSTSTWLNSSCGDDYYWQINSSSRIIDRQYKQATMQTRPACQIDLSKISWTKEATN